MPVNVYMSDNDRVVHMDYVDPWSLADLVASIPVQQALCDRFTKAVSLIVDLRGTAQIPPGIIRARESPLLRDPHIVKIIAVGGPLVAKILGDAVLRLARNNKAHFVDTLWQAMQLVPPDEQVTSAGPGAQIVKSDVSTPAI